MEIETFLRIWKLSIFESQKKIKYITYISKCTPKNEFTSLKKYLYKDG